MKGREQPLLHNKAYLWTTAIYRGYHIRMTKLDAIMEQGAHLSPEERARLIAVLLHQLPGEAEIDEITAGERGLAVWTESCRDEDWSTYYPETLTNQQGQSK
jgi:hypothetical protein